MGSPREDGFVKVIVSLEDHWISLGAEGMWATPLGKNLYRIENIPFYSYDLDYLDIVMAIEDDPEEWPKFVRVVTPSGHRTLRINFANLLEEKKKNVILSRLEAMDVEWEGSDAFYHALSVPPDVSIDAVREVLDEEQAQGTLTYETAWDKRSPKLH